MRALRSHITYANVVASLALFLALGGASYAAVATITSKNIKDGTVSGRDVKNRSLLKRDFKRGQLPRGASGPQGPAGPVGPQGAPGPVGVSGYEVVYKTSAETSVNEKTVTVDCPAGKSVLGGGGDSSYTLADLELESSYPWTEPTKSSWIVTYAEDVPTEDYWGIYAWAVCGNVTK